ncbi:LysR family transcriptional regulator [Deltaproteobacteria bacterium Smac51]|nr:LysR family transcriptional regulator [Deltaproteobacteria bacterium Smac51]
MKSLLNDMPLFLEVARQKSFTQAAEILDIPDSTVSRRISALEKELGVRLLNRNSRSVELTDSGKEFFEYCDNIVAEVEAARDCLVGTNNSPSGKVRISLRNDIYLSHLSGAFIEFAQKWPDIQLHATYNKHWVDLMTEPFDLDIRVGNDMPASNLVSRRLGQTKPAIYASPLLMDKYDFPESVEDLRKIPAIAIASMDEKISLWKDGQSQTVTLKAAHRFTCGGACLGFALAGLGLTLLSPGRAAPYVKAGELVRLLDGWSLPGEDVHLVSVSSRMPKRVRLFMDHLFEYSSRTNCWDL